MFLDHPAITIIVSPTETPFLEAAEVDADRVECALNRSVSTPASARLSFIQRGRWLLMKLDYEASCVI